jgi:hypothetical protein
MPPPLTVGGGGDCPSRNLRRSDQVGPDAGKAGERMSQQRAVDTLAPRGFGALAFQAVLGSTLDATQRVELGYAELLQRHR